MCGRKGTCPIYGVINGDGFQLACPMAERFNESSIYIYSSLPKRVGVGSPFELITTRDDNKIAQVCRVHGRSWFVCYSCISHLFQMDVEKVFVPPFHGDRSRGEIGVIQRFKTFFICSRMN